MDILVQASSICTVSSSWSCSEAGQWAKATSIKRAVKNVQSHVQVTGSLYSVWSFSASAAKPLYYTMYMISCTCHDAVWLSNAVHAWLQVMTLHHITMSVILSCHLLDRTCGLTFTQHPRRNLDQMQPTRGVANLANILVRIHLGIFGSSVEFR